MDDIVQLIQTGKTPVVETPVVESLQKKIRLLEEKLEKAENLANARTHDFHDMCMHRKEQEELASFYLRDRNRVVAEAREQWGQARARKTRMKRKVQEAERRAQEAERRAQEAECRAQDAERRAQDAERRAAAAEEKLSAMMASRGCSSP